MFNRAELFNKRASQPQFKAQEIIDTLKPAEGEVVADIGSGGGYFTMRFAREVGSNGTVYAVDINKKLLNYVAEYARKNNMTNVKTVLLDANGFNLPLNGCDLIFLRNVFHHIEKPVNYFQNLGRYLKSSGRVAVIDYQKKPTFGFMNLLRHHTEESAIRETMTKAGYNLSYRYEFLPGQSFTVYRRENP